MDQREEMVLAALSGKYTMGEVAERFEVSRPTVYQWVERYREQGRRGLEDRPPIARSCPHRTSEEVVKAVVEMRARYGWGPKKLRALLVEREPEMEWPQPSTIGEILKREGMVKAKARRQKSSTPFRRKYEPEAPGELVTVDFKGQFRTGDGVYCYPLTVMDLSSRYLLACQALPSTSYEPVWSIYRRIFRKHGLPKAVRSDNGVPFAGPNSLGRISRLSVQLMKLGIQPVLNDPGRPDQNGAHERMHATLAASTTRPAAANQREQQKSFDRFRRQYNDERPHEALGQTPPARHFSGLARPFPEKEPKLEYPSHFEVRYVTRPGWIKFKNHAYWIGSPLMGEVIGLEAVDEGIWSIRYGRFELARLDERTREIV